MGFTKRQTFREGLHLGRQRYRPHDGNDVQGVCLGGRRDAALWPCPAPVQFLRVTQRRRGRKAMSFSGLVSVSDTTSLTSERLCAFASDLRRILDGESIPGFTPKGPLRNTVPTPLEAPFQGGYHFGDL